MNTTTTDFNFNLTKDDMFAMSSLDKTTKRMFQTFNNPTDKYVGSGKNKVHHNVENMLGVK